MLKGLDKVEIETGLLALAQCPFFKSVKLDICPVF
jgi:hypothetical protein